MILGIPLILFFVGNSIFQLARKYFGQIGILEEFGLSIGLSFCTLIIISSLLGTFYRVSALTLFLLLSAVAVASLALASFQSPYRLRVKFKSVSLKAPNLKISRNELVIGASALILALFALVFHPLISMNSSGLTYAVLTNTSIIDLVIIAVITSLIVYLLKTAALARGLFLAGIIAVLAIALLITAKTAGYPSLLSYGFGNRIGIDTWDSFGHLLKFLSTGHYTTNEPYLLLYQNGSIITPPSPFPPGYFCTMGGLSMTLSLNAIDLTRSIYLLRILQTFFIFLLARKLTGDPVKGLLAALLIAGGTLASENVKFTSGILSPIASFGLALIPFGLYLMVLSKSKIAKLLVVLVSITLLYMHIASAALFISVAILYYLIVDRTTFASFKKATFKMKMKNKVLTGLLMVVIVAIFVPIADFWLNVYTDPIARLSIHYSERFAFLQTAQLNIGMFLLNNLFFLILMIYGITSYLFTHIPRFASAQRRESRFQLTWSFCLIGAYFLLFVVNQIVAYRIIAYTYQAASVIAGCALGYDIFERLKEANQKNRRKISEKWIKIGSFCILFLVIFAASAPSYIRSPSPDQVYLEQIPAQKYYYDFAMWSLANLTRTDVIIVNNFTNINDPANLLRDVGVTMVVGINMNSTDYANITATFPGCYALDTPNLPMGISNSTLTLVYNKTIPSGQYISLYNLTDTSK